MKYYVYYSAESNDIIFHWLPSHLIGPVLSDIIYLGEL